MSLMSLMLVMIVIYVTDVIIVMFYECQILNNIKLIFHCNILYVIYVSFNVFAFNIQLYVIQLIFMVG
jgi:hypothetical protein